MFWHQLKGKSRHPSVRAITIAISCIGLLAFVGCATHRPKPAASPAVPPGPPEPFVRVSRPETSIVELQIAARRFIPSRGRGPVVWLTGVSHVGDTNYFTALQRHLDQQTIVLFEGVGDHPRAADTDRADTAKSSKPATGAEVTPKGSAPDSPAGLQTSLATSLGLAFQLEAINYARPNFHNSDLSIAELRQLMDEAARNVSTNGVAATGSAPSAGGAQTLEALLQLMEGNSMFNGVLRFAFGIVGASPKLRTLGKLAMIETIGYIQGDPANLRTLPPELKQLFDVLIQKRNQRVVDDLSAEIRRRPPPASIAVFYGTGHMPDLETRLRRDLGYQPDGDLWFSAMTADLARGGVTEAEGKFLTNLLKQQLEQFGGGGQSP